MHQVQFDPGDSARKLLLIILIIILKYEGAAVTDTVLCFSQWVLKFFQPGIFILQTKL